MGSARQARLSGNERLRRFCRLYLALSLVLCARILPSAGSSAPLSRSALGEKPKAFVHIGPRKTGSTYVQQRMCLHRQQLEDRGVVVPICGACASDCKPKHFAGFAQQLIFGNTMKAQSCSADALACLREALPTDGSDVFISAEDLQQAQVAHMRQLQELLAAFDVQVILLHRRASAVLMSAYFDHQMQPPGGNGSEASRPEMFGQYLIRHATSSSTRTFVDLLRDWGAAFGEDHLHVLSYDGLRTAGADVFDMMMGRVLKLPALQLPSGALAQLPASAAAGAAAAGAGAGYTSASPPQRRVAYTAFLMHTLLLRGHTHVHFGCALQEVQGGQGGEGMEEAVPMVCAPLMGWVRLQEEAEAAALAASHVHRYGYTDMYSLNLLKQLPEETRIVQVVMQQQQQQQRHEREALAGKGAAGGSAGSAGGPAGGGVFAGAGGVGGGPAGGVGGGAQEAGDAASLACDVDFPDLFRNWQAYAPALEAQVQRVLTACAPKRLRTAHRKLAAAARAR